ncbi:MAG: His/Gly/Thr/Pro-type tRNA ligase C-terminal domain-containing protein, partial [Halobacteriales archaeon]
FTLLMHRYREDEVDGEARRYLALPPEVAPTLAGVFPLLGDDELVDRARALHRTLADAGLVVAYDDSGNIGRRYRRQDEVGTPYCVTVDHRTLEDDTVTLRDRDSTAQVRLTAEEVAGTLRDLRDRRLSFDDLRERAEPVDRGATG